MYVCICVRVCVFFFLPFSLHFHIIITIIHKVALLRGTILAQQWWFSIFLDQPCGILWTNTSSFLPPIVLGHLWSSPLHFPVSSAIENVFRWIEWWVLSLCQLILLMLKLQAKVLHACCVEYISVGNKSTPWMRILSFILISRIILASIYLFTYYYYTYFYLHFPFFARGRSKWPYSICVANCHWSTLTTIYQYEGRDWHSLITIHWLLLLLLSNTMIVIKTINSNNANNKNNGKDDN